MSNVNTNAESENNINNVHDVGYKAILSNKKTFVELLKTFVKKDWANQVDESNLVRIDHSYVLQDFSEKESDIVYKLKISDSEVIFYCLLELQSSVDFMMPFRLLLYMTEIWRDILKNTEKKQTERKEFRLPAIIPMVLYNGRDNWTACRSFKEILNGYELFSDNIVDFSYTLFDVNRYSEAELGRVSNLVSTVFMLDQDIDALELVERLKKQLSLLKKLTSQERDVFLNWVRKIIIMGVPQEIKEEVNRLLEENKEVETMVYNLEVALKREFQQRELKGTQEGFSKGFDKAQREIARKMLEKGLSVGEVEDLTSLSKADIESILSEISN